MIKVTLKTGGWTVLTASDHDAGPAGGGKLTSLKAAHLVCRKGGRIREGRVFINRINTIIGAL